MPVKHSAFVVERHITVQWDVGNGEVVDLVIRPDKMNIARLREWQACENSGDVVAVVALLLDLVESWDVLDEDGNVMPVCGETLDDWPFPIVGRMLDAISSAVVKANTEFLPFRTELGEIVA